MMKKLFVHTIVVKKITHVRIKFCPLKANHKSSNNNKINKVLNIPCIRSIIHFLSLTPINSSMTDILSNRKQSIDLQSKSKDWFIYDTDLRHEEVKKDTIRITDLYADDTL